MEKRELVILGAGPAGLTAAIYAKRAGLDALVIEKGISGGQVTTTSDIDNWPGHKSILGFDLAQNMHDHAAHFGTEFLNTEILGMDVTSDTKVIHTEKGDIQASAILIATGASHKHLGCPGEKEFAGKGVSYCAVCDGAFFRNEEIAVIGGGNTAGDEAEYLTRFASKVYLIHRRATLRADRMVAERVQKNPKIVPIWDTVVERIEGGPQGVSSLALKNVKNGEEMDLPVTGVFIFVGMTPNSAFVPKEIAMTPDGWIQTICEEMRTNVPGVFAAGDIRDTKLRQIVTASADGARGAMAAYSYLTHGA